MSFIEAIGGMKTVGFLSVLAAGAFGYTQFFGEKTFCSKDPVNGNLDITNNGGESFKPAPYLRLENTADGREVCVSRANGEPLIFTFIPR